MSLTIADEFLEASELTPTEFLQEIALHICLKLLIGERRNSSSSTLNTTMHCI